MKKILIALLLLTGPLQPWAEAALHVWYQHPLGPWQTVVFQGKIYASDPNSATKLWRSDDGLNWTAAPSLPAEPIGQPGQARCMAVHNGHLYVATVGGSSNAWYSRLYRSSDGQSWDLLLTENHKYSSLLSHGGFLYLAEQTGALGPGDLPILIKVKRSSGDGMAPVWQTLPSLPATPMTVTHVLSGLFVFRGQLHVVRNYILTAGEQRAAFSRLNASTQWENAGEITEPTTNITLTLGQPVVFNSRLYYSRRGLRSTDGNQLPYQWQTESGLGTNALNAAVIENRLYVISATSGVSRRRDDGTWEPVPINQLPVIDPDESYETVYFNNKIFLGRSYLNVGIFQIEEQTNPVVPILQAGENKLPVMELRVDANLRERLGLRLRNDGTAIATRDIRAVRLIDKTTGLILSELNPVSGETKMWETPQIMPLGETTTIRVEVDIAPGASPGTTCKFALQASDVLPEVNRAYSLPSTLAGLSLSIQSDPAAALSGPIKDAVVFPHPARDTVNFAYDLSDTSDVKIRIFDRVGNLVKELQTLAQPAGNGSKMSWDARSIAPGLYFAQFTITSSQGERRFNKRVYIDK